VAEENDLPLLSGKLTLKASVDADCYFPKNSKALLRLFFVSNMTLAPNF
jgi:hypothetical protein